MKICLYKIAIVFIFIGIFVLLDVRQVQGQEKQTYLSFNDILVKLTFTSRISKSTEEINERLIKDIQERKVNFILSSADEESLKKAGANEVLIKTISANLTKEIEERIVLTNKKIILYRKYTDNYNLDF